MTTHALRQNAVQIVHALALAPILVAALISAMPLIIPCITCRYCKELAARIRKLVGQS